MDILLNVVVGVCIIWLIQTLLGALEIKDPANKVIFVVTIILVIVWILTGRTLLPR